MATSTRQGGAGYRLVLVYVLLALGVAALLWRVVDLHVVQRDTLRREGDARAVRVVPVAAHRGIISDRHGEPLAMSAPVDSVWVQPQLFAQARERWPELARLLGLNRKRMARDVLARQDREFMYLKRRISPDLGNQVRALKVPGVSLLREYRRYYPLGEVAAHVVGFTNVDDVGQEGLELAYNDWLMGAPGSQRVLKDRLGRVIEVVDLIEAPRAGQDLALSLDRRLQYLAYRELKRTVLQHRARSGSAVVLDARSGEVLAMVNQPSYNPNNRGQLTGGRYRNRAVTDVFEPGSTIKPFTIAAALDSGRIAGSTIVDTTPGLLRVGGAMVRDIRNYGRIDVATVLKKSSNVGATKIVMNTPPASVWEVLSAVGFGRPTGSGFPGEASGLLAHHARWRKVERATLAFGYGMSVTALQLAHAYTVLSGDGQLRPVTFLRAAKAGDGEAALKPRTARQLRRILQDVVGEGGTAPLAAVPGYRVAGKTGTIKKAEADGYSDDRYIAVFVGMAPASDPRLVMAVVINEPRGEAYYGGEVAAPVFARVMEGAMRLLDVPPDNLGRKGPKLALVRATQ